MPPAARIGDMHTCPMVTGLVPHVGGPIIMGSPNVLTGGQLQARVTDACTCVGPPDVIVKGSPTVLIGGLMAARIGDMTAHGGVIVVGLPTVIIGDVGGGFGAGPLTPAMATAAFSVMAAQADIAFAYPVDGCYARAHLMVERLQQMGLSPGKVWSFSSDPSADPLWVSTPNHPDGKVEWEYHVAPTIPVQQPDGSVQDMVIDPSMFDRPVTVDEWRDAQHDHPVTTQTVPGEAPLGRPGSGYWPAPDPAEGPDAHARETMEDYKMREGGR